MASPILLVLGLKTMKPYFLSFGVSAKPCIAKYLIDADDICKKAVEDFIDSLLVENMSHTTP